MPQYFFVLGKNPALSCAEIISVLNKLDIPFETKMLSEEVLITETTKEISMESLIKNLGGTIKIGKIQDEVGFDEEEQKFEKIFSAENLITNYLPKTSGKLHFGISIYDGGADEQYLSKITNQLKSLNIAVKDNLKEKGLKMGFVRIKERFLSSVSVWKNQLLNKGMELVLILTSDRIFAGKTLAVQEFESFSLRDYARPAKDKRSGIMPPKLARMMINLASVPRDSFLLDPFCGSGTILSEAIMLGFKNISGSDISRNAIGDTKENIEWLFKNFRQLDRSRFQINVFESDVNELTKRIKSNLVDVIVTEPYLGPPLFKKSDLNTARRIISEVSKLYLKAFDIFRRILKPNGKVVFIFPAIEIDKRMHFVDILGKIKNMGFFQKEMIPKDLMKNNFIKLTARETILYGGREQFVRREIVFWQKL